MNENEDWLLAPVGAGMCRYESLIDGTLDLVDIARMNEFLAVKAENEARVYAALERQSEAKSPRR